jgi:sucrose phosphorylase
MTPQEERICRRLQLLYSDSDVDALFERCRSALGDPTLSTGGDRWSENDVVLIAYPDQISDQDQPPLATLERVLSEVNHAFSTIHILPFFPSSSDDGFAVVDHCEVAEKFGDWGNIASISANSRIMADLVLNHVSASHRWVEEFRNDIDPGRRCLLTASPDTDLSAVVRPRTAELLIPCETTNGVKHLWCTFSPDQVDVDWAEPEVLLETLRTLHRLLEAGVRWIRLDAVAYAHKRLGTACVHLEETHELVRLLRDLLEWRCPDALLISETNVPHAENLSYLRDGKQAHLAYNFTLAPLLIHALITGSSERIAPWLRESEQPPEGTTFLNFLGSHDGIGVRPVEDLLDESEIETLIAATERANGTWTGHTTPERIRPYEFNVAPASLLGLDRLLTGHTVVASLQGVPAFYLPAVEGEPNDIEAVQDSGHARAINRPKRTLTDRSQNFTGPRRLAREELARRLAIRRRLPAFHPDADQIVLNLRSPLFGVVRGEGNDLVTVVVNFGFSKIRYRLSQPNLDLLTDQMFHGEISLDPGAVLWLSTADLNSARQPENCSSS